MSWIMGVAHAIQRGGVPLDRCALSGASAGAFVAAMVLLGMDMHKVRMPDVTRGRVGLRPPLRPPDSCGGP